MVHSWLVSLSSASCGCTLCFNEMSEYIFRGGVEDGSLPPWEQILFYGVAPVFNGCVVLEGILEVLYELFSVCKW